MVGASRSPAVSPLRTIDQLITADPGHSTRPIFDRAQVYQLRDLARVVRKAIAIGGPGQTTTFDLPPQLTTDRVHVLPDRPRRVMR
jgi:hypothetical protein